MKAEKKVFKRWQNERYSIYAKKDGDKKRELMIAEDERFVELWNPNNGEVIEGYYISNYGNVIKAVVAKNDNNSKMVWLRGEKNDGGYKRITIESKKVTKNKIRLLIHRAVYFSFSYQYIKEGGYLKVYGEEDIDKLKTLKKVAFEKVQEKELINDADELKLIAVDKKEPLYQVHHKDLDKLNNKRDNLILLKKSVHDGLHVLDRRVKDIDRARDKSRFLKDIEIMQEVSKFVGDKGDSVIGIGEEWQAIYARNIKPSESQLGELRRILEAVSLNADPADRESEE